MSAFAAIDGLVSLGFDEPVSRKMLVLTRGDFAMARRVIENLTRNPAELARFASSIPIHNLTNNETILGLLGHSTLEDPTVFEIRYASDGTTLYSFTRADLCEFGSCFHIEGWLGTVPISSNEISDSPPFLDAIYRSVYSENLDHASVFVMEGLNEPSAIKLLKLARGRYCLAWTYLHVFREHGLQTYERAELFDELPDRDRQVREQCRHPKSKTTLTQIARGFLTAAVQMFCGHLTVLNCQDAREFLQRNPDLVA
jgi:hypothetical protein